MVEHIFRVNNGAYKIGILFGPLYAPTYIYSNAGILNHRSDAKTYISLGCRPDSLWKLLKILKKRRKNLWIECLCVILIQIPSTLTRILQN